MDDACYSPRRLSLAVLVVGLLVGSYGTARGGVVFLPGQEGQIVELLRPYSDENLVLETWALVGLTAGPECVVRLAFEAGAGDVATRLTLHPSNDGPGSFRFIWSPVRPERLGDEIEALVRGNDPGDFFRAACHSIDSGDLASRETSVFNGSEAAFQTDEPVLEPEDEEVGDGVGWAGLLWLSYIIIAGAGMVHLGIRGRRRRRTALAPTEVREPVWVWIVFASALGMRLLVLHFAPTFDVEFMRVLVGARFPGVVFEDLDIFGGEFLFGGRTFYRPPLVDVLLSLWVAIGDLLGVGGALLWFRIPTLVLSAWLMKLLLNGGQHLGAISAGRSAVLLFAFLPACVELSTTMTPYLLALVLSAWFIERVLAVTASGRPADLSLVLAAVVACWAELVTWPLVGVGMAVYLYVQYRRGSRRTALVALMVFACLVAPLVNTAVNSAFKYGSVDTSPAPSAEAPGGHGGFAVAPMDQPFPDEEIRIPEPLVFPWHLMHFLYNPLSTVLALLGIAAMLVFRDHVTWVGCVILALYAVARMRLQLSHDNLAFLIPILLLLPPLVFIRLRMRLSRQSFWRFLLPGWVALTLMCGVWATVEGERYHYTTETQRFYQVQARRILFGENVHNLRSELETLMQQNFVLVTIDETFFVNALSCGRLADLDAVRRCHEKEILNDSGALSSSRLVSLERDAILAHYRLDCASARALADRWLDVETPVLLLYGPETTLPRCVEEAIPGECTSRFRIPMFHLLLCEVAVQD